MSRRSPAPGTTGLSRTDGVQRRCLATRPDSSTNTVLPSTGRRDASGKKDACLTNRLCVRPSFSDRGGGFLPGGCDRWRRHPREYSARPVRRLSGVTGRFRVECSGGDGRKPCSNRSASGRGGPAFWEILGQREYSARVLKSVR